ncbi:MAG: glycerol-3-phosphate 1-O-acyltransferase PlsY [Hyphomonadaceae bacterium]
MDLILPFALAALGGYLLGSIPFGLLLTRAAGLGDIRNVGSGNIGATNVLRTGRRDIALATLLLDAGKAAAAILIARYIWGEEAGFIAGGAAFLGHCFPVWLGFKGGKGVATFFGVLFAGLWPVGLIAGIAWLLTAAIFRFSSLGALIAALSAPIAAAVLGEGVWAIGFCALLAALIYWRHRANIERLIKGEEPKIGAKKA